MPISSDKQEPSTPSPTLTPQNQYSTFVPVVMRFSHKKTHTCITVFKLSHTHTHTDSQSRVTDLIKYK